MVSFVIRPREVFWGGRVFLFYDRMGANGVERVDCRIYSTAERCPGPMHAVPFFFHGRFFFFICSLLFVVYSWVEAS